jgi:hypothetical protein
MADLGVYGSVILKWILKYDEKEWTGFIWLKTRTIGELL